GKTRDVLPGAGSHRIASHDHKPAGGEPLLTQPRLYERKHALRGVVCQLRQALARAFPHALLPLDAVEQHELRHARSRFDGAAQLIDVAIVLTTSHPDSLER